LRREVTRAAVAPARPRRQRMPRRRSAPTPRRRASRRRRAIRTRTTGIRFGIHLGHLGGPLAEMRKLWRFADERGFDWFSVSDHFQETPPQGGDRDCFESISTMAALAVETSRVRVACLVFCVGYCHPGG